MRANVAGVFGADTGTPPHFVCKEKRTDVTRGGQGPVQVSISARLAAVIAGCPVKQAQVGNGVTDEELRDRAGPVPLLHIGFDSLLCLYLYCGRAVFTIGIKSAYFVIIHGLPRQAGIVIGRRIGTDGVD